MCTVNEIQTVGSFQDELLGFFNRKEEERIEEGTGRLIEAEKTYYFKKWIQCNYRV